MNLASVSVLTFTDCAARPSASPVSAAGLAAAGRGSGGGSTGGLPAFVGGAGSACSAAGMPLPMVSNSPISAAMAAPSVASQPDSAPRSILPRCAR